MVEEAFGGRKQRVRGLESISLDEFAACLRSVLDHRALFGGRTAQAALPADWVAADHHAVGSQSRFVELSTPQSSGTIMLPPDSPDASASSTPLARLLARSTPAEKQPLLESEVLRVVVELTGDAATVDVETPLMDAGIDSRAATELAPRLRDLAGVALTHWSSSIPNHARLRRTSWLISNF